MYMVKIKVCGVTSPEDARLVYQSGVDMIGVIVKVNVSTPREISVSRAREVFRPVPDDVEKVVVTMPECTDDIEKLSRGLDVDYFQIHSDLSYSFLMDIRDRMSEKIIGVVSIPKKGLDREKALDKAEKISEGSDLILLDTKVESRGGKGTVHDWKISSRIRQVLDLPVILAGGLNPSNVRNAVERVDPFAVDVASGVESEPGRKDKNLIDTFVQEAGGLIVKS